MDLQYSQGCNQASAVSRHIFALLVSRIQTHRNTVDCVYQRITTAGAFSEESMMWTYNTAEATIKPLPFRATFLHFSCLVHKQTEISAVHMCATDCAYQITTTA